MSALFSQAARQERERFFWRLDSEWGKGLKQKTHPDRCPDFKVITKPNIISEWGVYSFGDKGLVYEASTKKEVRAWLLAVLTLYPLAHLELRSLAPRSKQTGVLVLPRTSEDRLHCDAQTLVTSKREPIGKDIQHVALGTFSDAPSPSSLPLVWDEALPFNPLCKCTLCMPPKGVASAITTALRAPIGVQLQFWGAPLPIW